MAATNGFRAVIGTSQLTGLYAALCTWIFPNGTDRIPATDTLAAMAGLRVHVTGDTATVESATSLSSDHVNRVITMLRALGALSVEATTEELRSVGVLFARGKEVDRRDSARVTQRA